MYRRALDHCLYGRIANLAISSADYITANSPLFHQFIDSIFFSDQTVAALVNCVVLLLFWLHLPNVDRPCVCVLSECKSCAKIISATLIWSNDSFLGIHTHIVFTSNSLLLHLFRLFIRNGMWIWPIVYIQTNSMGLFLAINLYDLCPFSKRPSNIFSLLLLFHWHYQMIWYKFTLNLWFIWFFSFLSHHLLIYDKNSLHAPILFPLRMMVSFLAIAWILQFFSFAIETFSTVFIIKLYFIV